MPTADPSFVYVNLATASAQSLGNVITLAYIGFAILLVVSGAIMYRIFST